MTQNEADILKNAIIDTVEAYVDARLSNNLNFVKTMIGTVSSNPIKNSKGKYEHTVKCNVTSDTQGIEYNNVLSVGNTPFPKNSVVFIIAPNAQFSNMFILGKLDDTPCNISAGSIRLGGHNEDDAPIYLTGTRQPNNSYGHIAGFTIKDNQLVVGDAMLSKNIIGCGSAGYGLVNMVGDIGANQFGYIQLSNSGTPQICLNGYRIYGNGTINKYDDNGAKVNDGTRFISNIPIKTIVEDEQGYLHWE